MACTVKCLLLACFVSSCVLAKRNHFESLPDSHCEPATIYLSTARHLPQMNVSTDTALTNHFSQHDLLMANATGILPSLTELAHAQKNDGLEARLDRVIKQQRIQSQLLLAATEIASLSAELDCEAERASQLATYLDQNDISRIRRLTLLSLMVGAATTVTSAFIHLDNTDRAISIGGGLISAGFGGAAAFSSNKSVLFTHKRNLLADIWNESERTTVFSPFIWYVLNEKRISNSGLTSIRYNIRSRWQHYALVNSSPQNRQLFFGPGGTYRADDLHARVNMLNQLQSSIRLINQDLQSLLSHFIN